MDNIKKLREDTAKYMGWEREGKYYTRNQMAIRLVSEWKPDLNSEQADMIEDKQIAESKAEYYGVHLVSWLDSDGNRWYRYSPMSSSSIQSTDNDSKSKKLARAMALHGTVKKAIDN